MLITADQLAALIDRVRGLATVAHVAEDEASDLAISILMLNRHTRTVQPIVARWLDEYALYSNDRFDLTYLKMRHNDQSVIVLDFRAKAVL